MRWPRDGRGVARPRLTSGWSVAIVVCLLGLVTVASGMASSRAGRSPHTSATSGPPLAKIVARTAAHNARRRSPAARARRRWSRRAYRGESNAAAARTAARVFPEVRRPAWHDFRLEPGEHIKRYTGTHSLLVSKDGSDLQMPVESPMPIATREADGDVHPVDLTLEDQGDYSAPRNPLVAVRIAHDARSGLTLERSGIGVGLAESAAGQTRTVEDKAFFANALTDVDFLITPDATGADLEFQLRSPQSPEQLALGVNMPPGASLRLDPITGAAAVVRGGRILASVEPPAAFDANHDAVPTSYARDGDRLIVKVAHRDRDVLYPILVDPQINTDYDDWEDQGTGIGDRGWSRWTSRSDGSLTQQIMSGWVGPGLYNFSAPGRTYNSDFDEWDYGAYRTGIYFPRIDFQTAMVTGSYDTANGWWGTCTEIGMWGPSAWVPGTKTDHCNLSSSRMVDTVWSEPTHTWGAGSLGAAAIFKLFLYGNAYRPTDNYNALRQVAIANWDSDAPSLSGLSTFGTRPWAESDSVGITGAADDGQGVGLRSLVLTADGYPSWNVFKDENNACAGTRYNPCPLTLGPAAHSTAWIIGNSQTGLTSAEGDIPINATVTEEIGRSTTTTLGHFRIDKTNPTVAIANTSAVKPEAILGPGQHSLKVTGSDIGANGAQNSGIQRFRWWVDGTERAAAQASACASGFCATMTLDTAASGGLSEGPHTIKADAEDGVGHLASQPQTFTVVVDRTGPTIDASGPFVEQQGQAYGADDEYDLWLEASDTRSDGLSSAGARAIVVSLDGQSQTSTNQPCDNVNCDVEHYWEYSPGTAGTHTVSVYAYDSVGNLTTRTFTVNVVAVTPPADPPESPATNPPVIQGDFASSSQPRCTVERDGYSDATTIVNGTWAGGIESTEYFDDANYRVTRCDAVGTVLQWQDDARMTVPDGTQQWLPIGSGTPTATGADGTIHYQASFATYSDPRDPVWASDWASGGSNLLASVIPGTKVANSQPSSAAADPEDANSASAPDCRRGGFYTNHSRAHWDNNGYSYTINPANLPGSNDRSRVWSRTRIIDGFRTWNRTLDRCSNRKTDKFHADYAGLSTYSIGDHHDGHNVAGFSTGKIADRDCGNEQAAACTHDEFEVPRVGSGRVVESDVIFDGRFAWWNRRSIRGCQGRPDIWSFSTHEVGHTLSLSHNRLHRSVMYPSIGACTDKRRVLGQPDVQGVRYLYGG